jgi:uncharacterized protein (TIGR02996 family)
MSAPFSAEEHAFLRGILTNPAELTGWLAYADWLDEHNDPRAEYIRLQARREALTPDDPERAGIDDRLRELGKGFNPYWVAFFDRPPVEHCTPEFTYRCPKRWPDLNLTREVGVRYCGECEQSVYYCDTIAEAQDHASRGRCVAVALTVTRTAGDLDSRPDDLLPNDNFLVLGIMAPPDPPPIRRRRPWWKFW